MLSDRGHVIPVADVSCLVADTGAASLGVCLKSGATIGNLSSLTFDYRESSALNAITSAVCDNLIELSGNVIEVSMLPAGEKISIVDIQGRVLWSAVSNGSKTTADISAFQPGCYILAAGGNTFKFLKR